LLLVVISIVFAMECVKGFSTSAKLAGLDKSAVWHGEWWRLFTAPLLHGNPVHFLFNALALVGLGRLMEVLASKFYLVLVFAIAALTGSVFSLLLLPGVTSVGASGGLLGLIGFLAVLGIRRKQSLPPGFAKSIAINIALLAMMGIIAFSLIDNAAHLGGLVAGLVLGQWLVSRGDPSIPLQTAPAIKIGGTIALMLVFGFTVFAAVRILTH
jgi:membrane associated rhomboid family serine protease